MIYTYLMRYMKRDAYIYTIMHYSIHAIFYYILLDCYFIFTIVVVG